MQLLYPCSFELHIPLLPPAGTAPEALGYVAVHGTGTPLGDPIEMGALGQALSRREAAADAAPHQLTIGSVKSCYGHTEGAAGLTGALLAVTAMRHQVRTSVQQQFIEFLHSSSLSSHQLVSSCAHTTRCAHTTLQGCAPILNLRNINPYVESTFADWQKSHRLAPNASRQAAPMPQQASQADAATGAGALAGTSSFGMSGVNAHALFEVTNAAGASGSGGNDGLATLARRRHWGLAPVFYLADRALLPPGGHQAGIHRFSFLTNLAKPELAQLWDHQVAGRVLIPGTAMFEACAAAACCLLDAPTHAGAATAAALHSVGLAEALPLPASQPSLELEAVVGLRDGSVQLRSIAQVGRSARRAATKLHCSGLYGSASMAAAAAEAQLQVVRTTPSVLRHLVAAAAMTLAGQEAAVAMAAIWVPHAAQQGGYCLQPAIGDAVLHLSGAFNRQATPLQIPVAMGALVLQTSGSHSCWVHPTAAPSAGHGSNVLVDYHVQAQQRSTVHLAGLQLKYVGAPPSAVPAVAAASQEKQSLDFLYSIEWQAEQVQASSLAMQAAAQQQLVRQEQSKGGWTVHGSGSSTLALRYDAACSVGAATSATAAVAVSDGLELLQRQLPPLAAGTCGLQVAGAPSVLPSSAAGASGAAAASTTAALSALLKVAGMEFAAVSIHSSRADTAAAMPSAPLAHDAFGSAASVGAVLRSKLLRRPAAIMPPGTHLLPLPRGSLTDLKLAPHAKTAPGPGEIKASAEHPMQCASGSMYARPPAPAIPSPFPILPSCLPLPTAADCASRGPQLPRCAQRAGHVSWGPGAARRRLRRRGGSRGGRGQGRRTW